MPVAAMCPQCGSGLREASVVAGAPHCAHCGAWIVGLNGTLGLTSAYGVGDPELTRRRIEADLGALREFRSRYTGMMDDCKEKLAWSAEEYAHFHKMLPQPPDLLKVKDTRSLGASAFLYGVIPIIIGLLGILWTSPWVESYVGLVRDGVMINVETGQKQPLTPGIKIITDDVGNRWVKRGHWHQGFFQAGKYPDWAWPWWILFFCFAVCTSLGLVEPIKYLMAVKANGDRPRENARRKKAHEEAMGAAMREAGKRKGADDHRRRSQIRELEGEIKATDRKIEEVRRLLAKP